MKNVIIAGATSGIGRRLVDLYLSEGWTVGVVGRRKEILDDIRRDKGDRVFVKAIDIQEDSAPESLLSLIEEMGGISLYIHSSGVGCQNREMVTEKNLNIVSTNVRGFTNIIDCVYHYFVERGEGHIVAISSVAGTRGIGIAAAYSASKAYQQTYLEALQCLIHEKGYNISVTDIRPGFVDTELLDFNKRYPMMMSPEYVAKAIAKAVKSGRKVKTIDWRYSLLVFFWKLLPSFIYRRIRV